MHKLTSKRQVTIPASVCEALNLHPGDYVEIFERDGVAHIVRMSHASLAGSLAHLNKRKGLIFRVWSKYPGGIWFFWSDGISLPLATDHNMVYAQIVRSFFLELSMSKMSAKELATKIAGQVSNEIMKAADKYKLAEEILKILPPTIVRTLKSLQAETKPAKKPASKKAAPKKADAPKAKVSKPAEGKPKAAKVTKPLKAAKASTPKVSKPAKTTKPKAVKGPAEKAAAATVAAGTSAPVTKATAKTGRKKKEAPPAPSAAA